MKIKGVCGFSPLGFVPAAEQDMCLPQSKFEELAARMAKVVPLRFFNNYPMGECWAIREFWPRIHIPNNPTAPDRFKSREEHVLVNYIQHQRTTWALMAAVENQDVDIWVWLDTGVLKQGAWRNEQVEEKHIAGLFEAIYKNPPKDTIPFPGIRERYPISDFDNHWRFCGSVHIWPKNQLFAIDAYYKDQLRRFVQRTQTMPGDLPIWGHLEASDVLPFKFYQGEYGYTQFTGYPTEEPL